MRIFLKLRTERPTIKHNKRWAPQSKQEAKPVSRYVFSYFPVSVRDAKTTFGNFPWKNVFLRKRFQGFFFWKIGKISATYLAVRLENHSVNTPQHCQTPIFIVFCSYSVPRTDATCTFRDTPFSTRSGPQHVKEVWMRKRPFADYGAKKARQVLILHRKSAYFPRKTVHSLTSARSTKPL